MSAVTAARLRELRAQVLDPNATQQEARDLSVAYLDACQKAPRAVLVWSWLRDWRRYSEADWDVLRIIHRQYAREGWR